MRSSALPLVQRYSCPPGALGPTPEGTAIIGLTVAAPPGCPGSAWRPADYPEALGASYDERMLHVRFARAEAD